MALGVAAMGQTMDDTLFSYRAEVPVVVDGQATEACWETAGWHNIDQVWMPYNATLDPGDFQGRFKVSWDPDYLYILVEVTDDSLSDDWSMGDHETNCNAFAYHVSLFFDVLDLDSNGQGINYKNHVTADRDTIGDDTYLWEFAFRIYDETYDHAHPENSRVALVDGKLMGLAVAYCDNDETQTRENFIGSMYMTAAHNNDMYRNADYFGPLVLTASGTTGFELGATGTGIRIWPNPAREQLHVQIPQEGDGKPALFILAAPDGRIVRNYITRRRSVTLDIGNVEPGLYLLHLSIGGGTSFTRLITKQ